MNHDEPNTNGANFSSRQNDTDDMQNILAKIGEGEIPLDDHEPWKLFREGPNEEKESIGYPFSSPEAMNGLERFRPSNIDELAAFVALYRPGPIEDGLFDEFIRRKETGDWNVTGNEEIDLVLGATFGMVLYAEDEEVTRHLFSKSKHLFKSRNKAIAAARHYYQRAYLWRQDGPSSIE